MSVETTSAGYKRNSQPSRLRLATLLAFLILNASGALGQGFKMTKPFQGTEQAHYRLQFANRRPALAVRKYGGRAVKSETRGTTVYFQEAL